MITLRFTGNCFCKKEGASDRSAAILFQGAYFAPQLPSRRISRSPTRLTGG
jgi:hypothetical protein